MSDEIPQVPFFCESCQRHFGMGKQAEIDGGYLLPVCEFCWLEMPVGDRLKFAADVRRHLAMEKAIDAVIELANAWAAQQKRDFDPFGLN